MFKLHYDLYGPGHYIIEYNSFCWTIPELSTVRVKHATYQLEAGQGWSFDNTVGDIICSFNTIEDLFYSNPELFI